MTLPRFTHLSPSSREEALDLLKAHGNKIKIIAGGSDLMVQLKQRTMVPEYIMDIKGLDGLSDIRTGQDNMTVIGSLTTLSTISESEHIKGDFPILAKAAGKVASAQIRNVATLGGNIGLNTRCWYYNQSAQWRKAIPGCYKMGGDQCLVIKNSDHCNAVFLADTVPALIVLGASVEIASKVGERTVPLEALYDKTGHPPNLLGPEEIMTEIRIPQTPANAYTEFFKDAPREVVDFALVNAAIQITFKGGNGACDDARIAFGGVTSHPVRSIKAEDALKGETITEKLIEEVAELVLKDAAPVSPIWVSPAQRRASLGTMIKKGLKAAKGRSQ
ncbi:MAG: xanthine dehydrogenase family protein subunit M [Deltaproteobacteria bacterium]|nr:xanthine dehydrogenase family protein subunit M [Deltaproteobacteria bacterium]